jgi:hypothetical protein
MEQEKLEREQMGMAGMAGQQSITFPGVIPSGPPGEQIIMQNTQPGQTVLQSGPAGRVGMSPQHAHQHSGHLASMPPLASAASSYNPTTMGAQQLVFNQRD